MKTIHLDLGQRSYPIHIGEDLISHAEYFSPQLPKGQRIMVVSNETVAPLYLDRLYSALDHHHCEAVILPDGESYKRMDVLHRIFDSLLESRYDRMTTTLVALGGGVIGDMTGFAAASYQRGVPFIQVPTTLLSQVDSSVGGKTGVNHPLGKNMIGAFYQPVSVVIDTHTLNTLEDRELRSGLAEVIKYGLIGDQEFFVWLETHIEDILHRDQGALIHAIERSCLNKARIVANDEREQGQRALLNLGHTFGHAIETGMGYGEWLHGEAVAAGIMMASRLSAVLGWLGDDEIERIHSLLERAALPVAPPENLSAQRFNELMSVDKKVFSGQLRLVLLKGIGKAVVSTDFKEKQLMSVLDSVNRP